MGLEKERRRSPASMMSLPLWAGALGWSYPTPGDCVDGFFEAFWRRPEALLDPAVRGAQSMWALLEPAVEQRIVEWLAAALDSGAWDAAHGHLREREEFQGALRLVISQAP